MILLDATKFAENLDALTSNPLYDGLPSAPKELIRAKRASAKIPSNALVKWRDAIRDICREEIDGKESVNYDRLSVADLVGVVATSVIGFVRINTRILATYGIHVEDKDFIQAYIYGDIRYSGEYIDAQAKSYNGSTLGCVDWIYAKYVSKVTRPFSTVPEDVSEAITKEEFTETLVDLRKKGLINIVKTPDGKQWVSAVEIAESEAKILGLGTTLKDGWKGFEPDFELSPFDLSRDQEQALAIIGGEEKLTILSGPGGSGKSTLLGLAESQTVGYKWLYLATTGKATQALREAGVKHVSTISRLAVICRELPETSSTYRIEALPYVDTPTVLVVDEVSMLSYEYQEQLLSIIEHLGKVVKVILTGDRYQLPPVGIGALFGGLCYYGSEGRLPPSVAYAELTTTHRFVSAKNPRALVQSQSKYRKQVFAVINDGRLVYDYGDSTTFGRRDFEAVKTDSDCDHIRVERYSDDMDVYRRLAHRAMSGALILARSNADCDGVTLEYMTQLRGKTLDRYYGLTSDARAKSRRDMLYKMLQHVVEGDLVRITKNITGQKAIKLDLSGPVYNGEIGKVVEAKHGVVVLEIGQRSVKVTQDNLPKICKPAAAITIHASQGSAATWCEVMISKPWITDTSLVYVATTRGRQGTTLHLPIPNNKSGDSYHMVTMSPVSTLLLTL